MPDAVLTKDVVAYCSHTGPPQPIGRLTVVPTQAVFTVGGKPVLLVDDLAAAAVTPDCPSHCAKVVPPATGSTVLTVNGVAVATMASTASTNAGTVVLYDAAQTVLNA